MIRQTLFFSVATLFFFTSALTRFATRAIYAATNPERFPDAPHPPQWLERFYYVHVALLIGMAFLHWKLAILVFAIKTIVSWTGILTAAGALMMSPFMRKPTD